MSDTARLVRRARNGEGTAFTELVRRYQNLAQGYAYVLVRDFQQAQDVAQERAWRISTSAFSAVR